MNLPDLRGWMTGEDAVIVAPGPSAQLIAPSRYETYWTLACNRAVTYARPDIAVCMEPARDECWIAIRNQTPYFVVAHQPDTKLQKPHPRCVHIPSPDVLQWITGEPSQEPSLTMASSAFYAAASACLLGFGKVGVIGVDLSDDRYSKGEVACANERWQRLNEHATKGGTLLLNLSDTSNLDALPKGTWQQLQTKPGPS